MLDELYNLIAEMIVYLINDEDKGFFKKYNSRTVGERKKELYTIRENVQELFEEGTEHFCELDHKKIREQGFIEKIERLFSSLRNQKDHRCILRLLEILDSALERQMLYEMESIGGDSFEGGLNSNWKALKLGIVPRYICYWERGHRGSQHYERIDNFLKNILVINYNALGDLQISNHFLPTNKFWTAEQRGSLSVAVSPLKIQSDFDMDIYEREETCYFAVKYKGNKDEDNRRIEEIIDRAAKEQADVLIFPEMLGNTRMVEDISNYLQEPFWLSGNKPPELILLPSVWEDHRNVSCLLNRTGAVICEQSKQEAYQEPIPSGGSACEDIFPDHHVHLIHGIGIGRMVIMICKDFITKDYLETILRELKVTFVLIPSYSTGYHDFETMSGALQASDCCALWTNACAAAKEPKEGEKIGFVLKSGRNTGKAMDYISIEDICKHGECRNSCLKVWNLYFKTILGR